MVSNLKPGHADSEDPGKLILSEVEQTLIQDFLKRRIGKNEVESMKLLKLLYCTFLIADKVPIPYCLTLKSFYQS